MTDPERLLKNSGNPLAALLLRAGAEEKPTAAVLSRTTQAVTAATMAVTAAAAASTASTALGAARATGGSAVFKGATLGVGAVAKWVAIGALGGAVALSSVQALIAEHGAERARAVATPGTNARSEKPSGRLIETARTSPQLVESAEPKGTEQPEVQKTQSTPPSLGDPAKPEAHGRTEGTFLAAEVRFVELGRSALQRGAFAEALEQLAPYEDRFPHQQLLTEVLFLRMEACSRLGSIERARALAARVLALGVVGRQAAQAREVLGP